MCKQVNFINLEKPSSCITDDSKEAKDCLEKYKENRENDAHICRETVGEYHTCTYDNKKVPYQATTCMDGRSISENFSVFCSVEQLNSKGFEKCEKSSKLITAHYKDCKSGYERARNSRSSTHRKSPAVQ